MNRGLTECLSLRFLLIFVGATDGALTDEEANEQLETLCNEAPLLRFVLRCARMAQPGP